MYHVLAEVFPSNKIIGECDTRIGIDIQAPSLTPGRKSIRIDINFFDNDALPEQVVETLIGQLKPIIESSRN